MKTTMSQQKINHNVLIFPFQCIQVIGSGYQIKFTAKNNAEIFLLVLF